MENMRSENNRGAAMEGVKLASEAAANTNRRALRDIKNILGAPHQPQAVSKRGLQEKPAAGAKSQAGAVGHRPVTRKFAAILQQTQPANAPLERTIVDRLEFNMSVPTPYCFMRRFLKAAGSDKKLELLSFFLIELSLVDYKMLKFQPSMLAAAAIYTAQCTLNGCVSWSKCCELHTKYSEEQLMDCSTMMVELHRGAARGKLTGVHRKYSTFKYGCAAKSEPAAFLLDARRA
ncbi:unnamed protein product [Triticum turgidum subsp. durum]|uniref:Cyclin C-terminal domain-containing protein n=1 Tax=Triticum turgidum subsp. durum TaxID=4567 RepID=A0A9R1C6C6_TRITD|nr:unnamed protein product [Triticum turgidum subsp. durum]